MTKYKSASYFFAPGRHFFTFPPWLSQLLTFS